MADPWSRRLGTDDPWSARLTDEQIMRRDYPLAVEPQPEPSLMDRLWDARPWQGYAQNPPSMMPQLAIALGLMGPRVGATTSLRDLNMARDLRGAGEAPAAMQGMPQGMPAPARPPGGGMRPGEPYGLSADPSKVPGNQNGNYGAAGGIGRREQTRAYESYIDSLPMDEHAVALQTFLRMQGVK